jgi:hypothetical protein
MKIYLRYLLQQNVHKKYTDTLPDNDLD